MAKLSRRTTLVCILFGFLVIILILLYIDNDLSMHSIFYGITISENEDPYVQRFLNKENGTDRKKIIMVWTTYFKTYAWANMIQNSLLKCPQMCDVTYDRTKLNESDAILFHFTSADLKKDDLPRFRKRHQVWCIHLNEPSPYLRNSLNPWRNVFNWTLSYRQHSTIRTPYGRFTPKQNAEVSIEPLPFSKRDKMAYALISRCSDDAYRYKIVKEIQKYISVDHYGRCGNLSCEATSRPDCLTHRTHKRYKFRLAFENSNCRDYITEKYWYSLRDGILPVVNWKEHQRSEDILPHTYINVYDFPDIVALTDYLKLVSSNETLYNSYFEWQRKYVIGTSIFDGFCKLCKDLYNTSIPAQVYTDLEGWLKDDTCKRFTYLNHYRRIFNRLIFDGKT